MTRALKQSTQRDVMVFMTDSTDHVTGKASLSLTITASKNGAAFASITPTVTDRGSGWYSLTLTTTHTNTLGDLALHITGTGADPTDVLFLVIAADLADSVRLGLTALPNAAAQASNGLLTSGTGFHQISTSSGRVGPDWANVGSPTTTVGLSGTTIKNTTDVNTLATAIKAKTDALTFTVANQVDANVLTLAGSIVTTIATSVLTTFRTWSHDTGATWQGLMIRLEAFITGLATGQNGPTGTWKKRDGTTTAFTGALDNSVGTRGAADISGSE